MKRVTAIFACAAAPESKHCEQKALAKAFSHSAFEKPSSDDEKAEKLKKTFSLFPVDCSLLLFSTDCVSKII
jgi:hypothetical protein